MKVLFLTNGLRMGGIETNLALLAEELASRGHRVVVASQPGLLVRRLEACGARHVPLRVRLRSPLDVLRDARDLRRLVREERPDVVHVMAASAAVLRWLAFPLGGGPPVVASVMGLQNSPTEPMVQTQARNWAHTLGARRVLVISPEIGRLLRRLPVARARLLEQHVVGVRVPQDSPDPAAAARARRELGLAPGDKLVVTIGALAPRKSHELFIRAAADVVQGRRDVHFAVVGEGPDRARLQAEIERLGVGDRVRLLGHVPDIAPLLEASDVVVKPGIVEGFIGITVLEAQARHTPVVAFDTDDVKLAITDGETGLIVPRGDTAALARAIVRVLDDPELARSLAKRGRAHVEARWSIPAIVDGLLALYEREARPRS